MPCKSVASAIQIEKQTLNVDRFVRKSAKNTKKTDDFTQYGKTMAKTRKCLKHFAERQKNISFTIVAGTANCVYNLLQKSILQNVSRNKSL